MVYIGVSYGNRVIMVDIYELEYPTETVTIEVAPRRWRARKPDENGKKEVRSIGTVVKGPKALMHKAAASVLAEYKEFTGWDAVYKGERG